MSVIRRNNAVDARSERVGQTGLGEGGSGRGAGGVRRGQLGQRLRRPRDPAAELMPAAEFLGQEPDFAAILEDFRDSPFDPVRRRVLGRLMGVFAVDYQSARSEERQFLKRLLATRNAREGYAANCALHLCAVPHAIRRTLALGVAEARFPDGAVVGFLGSVQARLAATAFKLLGPNSRERIWNLLTKAGVDAQGRPRYGADRVLERALILKAVAARRHRLGPWAVEGEAALTEVEGFAEGIRGCHRPYLAARTTLIAGDPQRPPPPLPEGARAGAEIARGEMDPVYAWRCHAAEPEFVPPPPEATPRRRRRRKLEIPPEEALPDLDRGPLLDRVRLHAALAEARCFNHLPRELADAMAQHLTGRELGDTRQARKDEALRALENNGFDVMRRQAVEAIREDARGIYRFEPARALSDLLSAFTGATYVRRQTSDQMTAASNPTQQLQDALAQGLSIPIGVRELQQKKPLRAFVVQGVRMQGETSVFDVFEPATGQRIDVPAHLLVASELPEVFGRKARMDAYLAPAALDLMAPPFGLAIPELGIEDRL